jgi:RNA polymerase sigma-70 factor (ECF subfamily)
VLNAALAGLELRGEEPLLRSVRSLDLGDYRYLHATRADLLARLGRDDEARAALARALAPADDEAERRLLERRMAELSPGARRRPA